MSAFEFNLNVCKFNKIEFFIEFNQTFWDALLFLPLLPGGPLGPGGPLLPSDPLSPIGPLSPLFPLRPIPKGNEH